MKKRVSIIVAAVAFFVMLFGLCNISALAGEPQYYTLRFFSGGGVTSSNETKIEMRIPVGQPFPAEDSITKFNRVGYDFKGFLEITANSDFKTYIQHQAHMEEYEESMPQAGDVFEFVATWEQLESSALNYEVSFSRASGSAVGADPGEHVVSSEGHFLTVFLENDAGDLVNVTGDMVGVKGFSDKDLGEDAGCCLGSYQIPAFTNTAQYHSWMISFEKLNTVGTIYGEGGITGERYNVTITKIIKTYRLSYTVHASDSFGEP